MIDLTEEQQMEEDARNAKIVLENPIFQRVVTGFIQAYTQKLLELEPHEKEAFTIIQAPRQTMLDMTNKIQAYTSAKKEKEREVL